MKRSLGYAMLLGTGVAIGIFVSLTWRTYSTIAAPGDCQDFPQTGHKVCGRFLNYWLNNGALAQQGYPLSEEFTETSDLNGKPYTVQYFERAVFELHPENQPPNDVLLSQLGTYLAKENYSKGFPATSGETPFYEKRTSATDALKSYYNAVNRKEYERAYSYFQGSPNPSPDVAPPYNQFVAGYADTVSTTLAVGKETIDAGAGNIYSSIPVVITAKRTNGSTETFSGCYFMHRVNDGISLNPLDELWSINFARLSTAPANTSVDAMLAQTCTR